MTKIEDTDNTFMSKSAAQLAVEGPGKQGYPKASMEVEMTLFKKWVKWNVSWPVTNPVDGSIKKQQKKAVKYGNQLKFIFFLSRILTPSDSVKYFYLVLQCMQEKWFCAECQVRLSKIETW